MKNEPEFSRLLRVDRVPATGCTESVSADAVERVALAKRFNLIAIHSLAADIDAQPVQGRGMQLNARIRAEIEQCCVVTLEGFTSIVETEAQRIYLPEGSRRGEEDNAETDTIKGDNIDLGEFIAEELGLALDPYPRKPGVSFAADAVTETSGSPFGALEQLKSRH